MGPFSMVKTGILFVVILTPENLFHDHSFDGCFRMR